MGGDTRLRIKLQLYLNVLVGRRLADKSCILFPELRRVLRAAWLPEFTSHVLFTCARYEPYYSSVRDGEAMQCVSMRMCVEAGGWKW